MPQGIRRDERVWHSSEFLERFGRTDTDGLRNVAVVGAGQSAAEITAFFHERLPHAQVHAILPAYGYSVADDTPFANQIFDSAAVDELLLRRRHRPRGLLALPPQHQLRGGGRRRHPAPYQIAYDEDVAGTRRFHYLNLTKVRSVEGTGATRRVHLTSSHGRGPQWLDVDAIVFATGYDTMDPAELLGDLDRHCLRDESGHHRVTRDYRLVTTPEVTCGIYLQGGTEHTHGLSSSLLSNIAVRSGEIADSIIRDRAPRELAHAGALGVAERSG
ncbi:L-lysine N6-monooxygenase MbtG OS=Streptomyces tendae OX=1932 GN=GUR47_05980 PE=3 SV=1 [Streptomyces tendae]